MNRTINILSTSRTALILLLALFTTATAWADKVTYINMDGPLASHDATPLYGWEPSLGQDEQETWYYVDKDITYDGTIECHGDVHIILADGKTMTINSDGNGIVVYDGGSLTIYGQELGTGTLNATGGDQGIHSESGNITICSGTVNATGDNNGIHSDFGDITISGGRVTATATSEYNAGIFTISGTITLGCTTTSDFIKANRYGVQFGSVKIAEGQKLYDEDGTEYSCTLTSPYPVGKTLRRFPYVQYIDANGQPAQHGALKLDGTETTLGQDDQETWYYVGTNISYSGQITCYGDVNIILTDGKTMTINSSKEYGINGADGSLTIYGQDQGTGILTATSTASVGIMADGFITINGGKVTATGTAIVNNTATGDVGIYGVDGVTINGGTVNATGIMSDGNVTINGGKVTTTDDPGISSNSGIVTLGWTSSDDRITASSYVVGSTGTVKVADGQAFIDGSGHFYSGTLSAEDIEAIADQTLQPCLALADAANNTAAIADHAGQTLAVALSGRTLYKDGSWNTLCLPFSVSTASGTLSGDNVQAMTLNTSSSSLADGTLTLNFTAATTIPAGTPFIIKWDESGTDITNPVFEGVTVSNATNDATVTDVLTFTGTYAPKVIGEDGDNTVLYLGAANKLYYPTKDMTIGTHRAYFQLLGDLTAGEPASPQPSGVRAFVLNFGDETTGIISVHDSGFTVNGSDAWYTLDGRKLSGKPTRRGLYIHNGIKVVIK